MNGILIIDKPEDWTSHDVVGKLRGILRTKSIGHTGTLDPFATGVLVCLIGRATRLAQFLDKAEKEYLAVIQLGFSTDTGDRTGSPKSEVRSPKTFSDAEIENALAKFRGEIWQTPPMYSAKKIAGKKLYDLARQGIEVERQPVKVNVSKLEISEQLTINNYQLSIRVAVSAGTYIRVLAEDIGRELGAAAHLAELRRTRAGKFDLSQAVTITELQKLAEQNQIEKFLISPNDALAHLPFVELSAAEVKKTLNGLKLRIENADFADSQFVRLCDENTNLIAVGVFDAAQNSLQPRIVLSALTK